MVLEVKTDPDVPPLPPHITLKQAKAFTATLMKGDPDEGGVILGTARQVLASVLPGKEVSRWRATHAIGRVAARAYEIPTDEPEADGTCAWDRTTLVLVEIEAGGETGLGYTYADASIVPLIAGKLATVTRGRDRSFDIAAAAMRRCGAACAISGAAGSRRPRSRPSTPRCGI